MGYIKEPEGIDFIIKSEPLTDEDREKISQFIQEYKRKSQVKKEKSSTKGKKKNTAPNKMQRGCPSHRPNNHKPEHLLL